MINKSATIQSPNKHKNLSFKLYIESYNNNIILGFILFYPKYLILIVDISLLYVHRNDFASLVYSLYTSRCVLKTIKVFKM